MAQQSKMTFERVVSLLAAVGVVVVAAFWGVMTYTLDKSIDGLNESIGGLNTRVNSIDESVRTAVKEISDNRLSAEKSLADTAQQLRDLISANQEQLAVAKVTVDNLDKSVGDLNRVVGDLGSTVDSLGSSISALNASFTARTSGTGSFSSS
jgi:hypothetical protein